MSALPQQVAVVDDDPGLRESLVGLLASAGYAALAYASAEAFLQSTCVHACVILDWRLPGMSGPELIEHLRAIGDRVPVVMISANAAGAPGHCLRKPFAGEQLLDALRDAIRQHEPKVQ
jgi:FixJ family two-component response regulator